ncbi:MAG TPA: DUF4340 domain-containing protein [Kofleriaceae bacterium]|nr:DUF4340 domain-containing protein [Kofleriaceae bacterium]
MRGALIHGILLAVMLVYGYRTWTRDKTVKPDRGSVVLWDKAEAELASIEYKTERKTVRLEQRSDASGAYWWGQETTIEKRPKPVEKKPEEKKPEEKPADPKAAGSAGSGSAGSGSAAKPADPKAGSAGSGSAVAAAGSGSAGSGAGSGSAATPPPEPPVVMEEVKRTTEFPAGDGATKLLDGYVKARALRDLGVPTDALKKDYKLDGSTTLLTVAFKDGSKREYVVGGSVFNTTGGASDRYVMDKQSGKAYVLAKDMLGSLEIGQSSLNLTDPRGFDTTLIGSVDIEGKGKKTTVARVTTGAEGQQVKTWGDAATKKANQTLANFIDNAANLKPTEYKAQLKAESMRLIMKLTYKDERGGKLGTLALYSMEKPGELPEGAEFDPANPPRGETEYYIVTEKTRVPGLVRKDTAQRAEQDLGVVFDNPPEKVTKPGMPSEFSNTPLPPPEKDNPHGGGAPPNPHGDGLAPPNPHGGGAAPPAPGAPGGPAAGSAGAKAPGAPAPAGGAAPAAPAGPKPPAGPAAPAAPKAPAGPAAPAAPKPAPAGSAAPAAHDGHAH